MLTPDVYTDGKYTDQLIQQIMNGTLLLESIECYNVFENYINKLYPGILEIKENLYRSGLFETSKADRLL